MAVSSALPYIAHVGNGSATIFAFPFTLLDAGDLRVTIDGVATTAYTVSGIGNPSGGSVQFAVAPANASAVVLERQIELVRAVDYQNNGDLLAPTLNGDLDRIWMGLQQSQAAATGALRVAAPERTIGALPPAAARASRVLAFDAAGNPLALPGVDSESAAALALDLTDDATASKGAGQIGVGLGVAYAEGTIGRRLADVAMTPQWFGGDPTGVITSTAALQAAAAEIGTTSNDLYIPVGTEWVIDDTITITGASGFRIHGMGKIRQAANNKPIFSFINCTDFAVEGVNLYGKGTDFAASSDTGNGVGLRLTGCARFRITGSTFRNFGYAAIRLFGNCSRFTITGNLIEGTHLLGTAIAAGDIYQFGVIVQSGASLASPCTRFRIADNDISDVTG